MTIRLSTIGSTDVTVDVRPSPFPEAAGGLELPVADAHRRLPRAGP